MTRFSCAYPTAPQTLRNNCKREFERRAGAGRNTRRSARPPHNPSPGKAARPRRCRHPAASQYWDGPAPRASAARYLKAVYDFGGVEPGPQHFDGDALAELLVVALAQIHDRHSALRPAGERSYMRRSFFQPKRQGIEGEPAGGGGILEQAIGLVVMQAGATPLRRTGPGRVPQAWRTKPGRSSGGISKAVARISRT